MAQAHPKPGLRPFLPDDVADAGRDLRRKHRGADRRRLQRGAAGSLDGGGGGRGVRQAARRRPDADRHAGRLARRLRLAARQGSHPTCSTCIQPWRGRALATMLVDALEKLAGGRGAEKLTVDASDTAEGFFAKRGYIAMQRNTHHRQRRVARQHHHAEDVRHRTRIGSAAMSKERLYLFDTTLRDGAQTNGVDFSLTDKQVIAAHARRARHRLCRGRLSRRQSARHRVLRQQAEAEPCALHRLRHDAAGRALGLQRSRRRRASGREGRRDLLRGKVLGLSGPRRAGDDERRKPRRRSATASRRRRPPAAR